MDNLATPPLTDDQKNINTEVNTCDGVSMNEFKTPSISLKSTSNNLTTSVGKELIQAKHTYFHSERLEAFCDAVLAIVATILITPLKLSSEQMQKYTIEDNLYNKPEFIIRFILFISGFFFIVSAWDRHMKIFYIYPVADNFILWLNIIFLLACSVIPLCFTLLHLIGAISSVLVILFVPTLLMALAQSCQILYSNWSRHSLPSHIHSELFGRTIIGFRVASYLFAPLLLLMAPVILYIDSPYRVFISSIFVGNALLFGDKYVNVCESFYSNYRKFRYRDYTYQLKIRKFRAAVTKSRVEFFTDGIFAIVATIIILDTTTEITNKVDLNDDYLSLAEDMNVNAYAILYESRFTILSYVNSFLIVCLFWFVNHSIFHYIHHMTRLMNVLNTFAQLFVCIIPFCANIMVGYANKVGDDSLTVVITLYCTNLFIIGMMQIILWMLVRFGDRVHTQGLQDVADFQMRKYIPHCDGFANSIFSNHTFSDFDRIHTFPMLCLKENILKLNWNLSI
ncbi:hypothetical protein LOD99_10816 [Oopsacas minuta]|uniref:Endosomal/lysosomal proton channel TMEM175 n=1 Tax=Oopsacas minuta TaxID=111878 RepID=A0AAV7KH49_9METZ|nr:hypothetical protein LOD99_10816 [Oopsacas minuta]